VLRGSLIFTLTLACSSSVFAQSYKEYREWEGTLFAGTSIARSFQFSTPLDGAPPHLSRTVGVEYNSGYLLGARVDQNLGDYAAKLYSRLAANA